MWFRAKSRRKKSEKWTLLLLELAFIKARFSRPVQAIESLKYPSIPGSNLVNTYHTFITESTPNQIFVKVGKASWEADDVNPCVVLLYSFKQATSRYFELFFWVVESSLIGRKPLNDSLTGKKNTKETRINQKGTRMVKDGED